MLHKHQRDLAKHSVLKLEHTLTRLAQVSRLATDVTKLGTPWLLGTFEKS